MTRSTAYSPLDGLVDLACRDGVEIRPTLLRVLTDLYVRKAPHSAEEEAQYIELALRLLDAVDAPTRKAVAASLSTYANAPVAVLRRLIELSAASGAEPAARSAQAAPPSTTREPELIEAFFAAAAAERKLILANLAVAGHAAPRRATPAAGEVIRRLEAAAMQRNPGEFARILERALGIDRAVAERVTRDASGEPVVVAAKALAMPAVVLQRVLLCLNPAIGQSVARVFELSSLYEEMPAAAAERMVTIWREANAARKAAPAHAPVHWDDSKPSARQTATPAPARPATPRREELTSWHKSGGR